MAKKPASSRSKSKAKQSIAKPKAKAKVSPAAKPAIKQLPVKLLPAWQVSKKAASTLWQHRRLFIVIAFIYGLLNFVLVQGLASGTDVANLKDELSRVFTGHFGAVASSLSIFAFLVSSSGNSSSDTAGAYQLFIGLITSLVIIWSLRKVMAGEKIKVRDAYYRGMYPLVPFLLVLMVIGLQLLPLIIGSALYNIVISNNIAANLVEKVFWAGVFGSMALTTIYMLGSSLFALYIVTLPGMTPIKALRSARKLVNHRRWTVLRKIAFLPIIMLILSGIIMVPIIILVAPLAQWIFFILSMFALIATHAYMYTLYRNLLGE